MNIHCSYACAKGGFGYTTEVHIRAYRPWIEPRLSSKAEPKYTLLSRQLTFPHFLDRRF